MGRVLALAKAFVLVWCKSMHTSQAISSSGTVDSIDLKQKTREYVPLDAESVHDASPPQEMANGQTAGLQQNLDWVAYFKQHSQLVVAIAEPSSFVLKFASDRLCQLAGIPHLAQDSNLSLLDLLPGVGVTIQQLYRKQVLQLVLRDIYQFNPQGFYLWTEPAIVSLPSRLFAEPRLLKFWLRVEHLRVTRLDVQLDEFAELHLHSVSTAHPESDFVQLAQMQLLEQRLCLENYKVEGLLLLEGLDVTEEQIIWQLTQLLIDRNSILQPEKFKQVNQLMRSLFHAESSLILSAENEQVRLFMGLDQEEWQVNVYLMQALQESHFLQAAETNQVTNIADLTLSCPTDCERSLSEIGVRSLLIIPLVVKTTTLGTEVRRLAGLVGLTSNRPGNFDSIDCHHAAMLIPALTAALRHATQQPFSSIHSSVEWRFAQEAERRSWGLPPEPIVFENVYPLYGISDIRGSSEERNRAIQADLLEQFHLGLVVVEAVCQHQETSLGYQLRLDLQEHIEQLRDKVTVDAEVTANRYLRDRLEVHFDYFSQCGSAASAAVQAYQNACANDHHCVYTARARYDQVIQQINVMLRETWDNWQVRMQQITHHYCDIESTDGIDHMLYAGESIDSNFCLFHLRSLRYEQLCAVCDCARTALTLKKEHKTRLDVTHLVLVQDVTIDIFHDESTEKLFDVRGARDTRYEIVKKRIDKAVDGKVGDRITQPGMLTLVYSTPEEWEEYAEYFRYLIREGWINSHIEFGTVEPLQGVTGLKFARTQVLPAVDSERSNA